MKLESSTAANARAEILRRWLVTFAIIFGFGGVTSLLAQRVVEVPFELYKNEPIAEVMIDGKGPFMMMLDTGTDPSAIDLTTADAVGIRRSTRGLQSAGGGTDRNLSYECKLRNVELGALVAGTIDAGALDLSTLSDRMGKHIDGILGYSLFKNRIVQFDFPHSVARFFDSAPSYSARATTVKFHYSNDVLIEDVLVNGIKVAGNLDTGSSGTVQLSPRGITRLGLADAAAAGAVHTSVGYNGAFVNREGKLASLKIGGSVSGTDLDVRYFGPNTGHDKVPWDVNIGNGLLKAYIVTVDYRARTVTFDTP